MSIDLQSRPTFDLAAQAERLRACIAQEQASGYMPKTAQDVPVSVTDANAAWLTAVLCSQIDGARVEAVSFTDGSDGMTSRRGLRLRYNHIGRSAGLPEKLFGKATPQFQSRLLLGMSGAIFCERDFYTLLRPHLSIEAPIAHFAATDPDSLRSIILFADMSEDGTVFTDPSHYIDRAKAEDMVTLMAQLHATFWQSPLLDRLPRLKTSLAFQQDVNAGIDFEARSNIGIDRAASILPASIRNHQHAMWHEGLMASMAINSRLPATLVHSDVHIGNWYITPTGRMGLTDWQCIARGHGAGDLAYALSSALTIDDRRAWEGDLVSLYADRLRAFGVPAGDGTDNMWLRYRQQMFHAFYNWVFTIGAGEMQPDMQPDHIAIANIERMASAIEDLDSLQAVRADS